MKKLLITLLILLFQISYAVDIDEKISQMVIVGFDGNTVNSRGFKRVVKDIKNKKISGVILFNKNIKNKDELKAMTEILLNASDTKPFIAVDYEGGFIDRFKFIETKSAKQIAKHTKAYAHKQYSKMADLESEIGINLNLAPCVDLEINKKSIISKKERSFSDNPDVVSKYASIFIEEHAKKNIITSIKHFPGHGSVTGDTHKGFVDATEVFAESELVPYKNLSKYSDRTMVMASHIYNSKLDETYPASLSDKTINGILINKLGFKGVVISDDFDMGAIRKNYKLKEIVPLAINSGTDILLFSNNLDYRDKNIAKKVVKIAKKEIKRGNISQQRIDEAYNKIISLKKKI